VEDKNMEHLTPRQFWGRFFRSFYNKNVTKISVRSCDRFRVLHNPDFSNLTLFYKTSDFYKSEFDVFQILKKKAPIDITFVPIPILFALHEIGHTKTPEVHCDVDTIRRNKQYMKGLDNLIKTKQVVGAEMNEIYHTLPFEVAANEWAFNYIKNNREELNQFITQFREVYIER
jgi:hypothetical protein